MDWGSCFDWTPTDQRCAEHHEPSNGEVKVEKFWSLVRMNRDGRGKPVWANSNNLYRSLSSALEGAELHATASPEESIIVMEATGYAKFGVTMVPVPVPACTFTILEA